jgi:peptidoglycan L-alanyl-D-glutamate endopeptidase CwlK
MPKLSSKSISILVTCSQNIQDVMRVAIVKGPDFSVISGRRSKAEQAEKVRLGYSKTMKSKHVADDPELSHAIDIGPYIPDYGLIIGTSEQVKSIAAKHSMSTIAVQMRIWKQYGLLAGYIMRVAEDMQIPLTWGGDWDRDWNAIENNFEDLGHFEEVI